MMKRLLLLLCILLTFTSRLAIIVNAQDTRIIALELQPTELFCTPPSGRQATWYYNEEPVRNNGPYEISSDRLTLVAPTQEEAGRYTCIDPDQTPTDLFSVDYILVVGSPPVITSPPVDITNVSNEASITFGCVALGSPPPDIRWTINNQDIAVFSTKTKGTGFLDVSITPAVQLGTYTVTCVASNRYGNDSRSATFTIVDRTVTGTAPPVSFVASVGSSVTFNCFSQQPPPGTNIQWTRNGTALNEISPSLNITATVDNTGVYCCDVNGTIVNCGYLFTGVSPFIDNVSPSISTVTGRTVSLYCHAMGEYAPTITWQYSDGTQIEDTPTTMVSQVNVERSFLRLTNVFTEFEPLEIKCVATNNFSVTTHVISVATVGFCGDNILTDPDSIDSQWQFISQTQASFTTVRGESVFQIEYSDLNVGEDTSAIVHLVTVNSNVDALHLRAQVRQEDASPGYLPTICLTSGVDEICTRLDTEFTENPMGWQWVELYADLLAQGPLVQRTMQVSLFARGNTVNSRDGRVFFDNICLETFHEVLSPSSSSSSSSSNIGIIVGASVGGVVLLIVVVVVIVGCCLYTRKSSVKIVQFRKQGDATIRRSTGNANTTRQAIRNNNGQVKTQAANQDNADSNYNYITPNKVELGCMTPTPSTTESTDEIYTDSKGNYYIKLMTDPTKEPNHYQAIKDETIKLYESIQEPEQPQYEALIGEVNEPSHDQDSEQQSQYETLRGEANGPSHVKDDQDFEQQPQLYLDVVSDETNEEIYSDISDTIEQVKQLQAQEDDQKSED